MGKYFLFSLLNQKFETNEVSKRFLKTLTKTSAKCEDSYYAYRIIHSCQFSRQIIKIMHRVAQHHPPCKQFTHRAYSKQKCSQTNRL